MGPYGYTLFFSVHFIHIAREDAMGSSTAFLDEVREETFQYWQECKWKFINAISVVAGFDANVTLPTGVPDTTGYCMMPRLQSHSIAMQQRIIGWMKMLGIHALNTLGHIHSSEAFWTCGVKRRMAA